MTQTDTDITDIAEKITLSRSQAIKAIAAGGDLAQLRGVNEATIDFIYAFSALNYKQGKYKEAASGFRFLCRHKHRDPDMWLAYARALFGHKDYMPALESYLMVAVMRPSASLCLEIARAFMVANMPQQAGVFIQAAGRALLPGDSDALRRDIAAFEKELEGAS